MAVTPAYKEPMPGWVDSLNGPVGVTIAGGKGVLRSMLCDGSLKADMIPVDFAINDLIIIPHSFSQLKTRPSEIPVYNLRMPDGCKRSWKWILEKGQQVNQHYPLPWPLWYPNATLTLNKYYHFINSILFMWLPALLIDGLLALCGQRRFMIYVQKRILVGLEVLQFFTTRSWDFRNDELMKLIEGLSPKDLEIFEVQSETKQYDIDEYLKQCCLGGRLYMCKEPISNVPKAKIILKCMYVLDVVCKTLICGWFFYWLASKIGIMDFVEDLMDN